MTEIEGVNLVATGRDDLEDANTSATAGVTEIVAGAEMIRAGETAEQIGKMLETRTNF
jgi:hypothetical protein